MMSTIATEDQDEMAATVKQQMSGTPSEHGEEK
jgi:hypothetical protein